MSGPVSTIDAPPVAAHGEACPPELEVTESREETVGRIRVRRALPRRGRRTVSAWCFADHMGPASVTENASIDVGPHPHIGLQTVTWLLDGQVLHRDSLGNEQVIRPGQLNLMTAGGGVSHSEEATGHYRGELDGIQLWVAQPDAIRNGAPAFEHHAEIPSVDIGGGVAAVFVGEFMDVVSPARRDTALVGVDLALAGGPVTVALRPDWEYALVIMHEQVTVDGGVLTPGHLAYLGLGRDELRIDASPSARVVLLGGEPFDESIVMWWNFVARDRAELEAAYRSWQDDDGRFGRFASPLRRIPAPTPYWT